MEHDNFFDLVEIRDRCDTFLSLVSSQPYEALRYFKIAADHVKALNEKRSEVYQPAKRLLDTCILHLTHISPLLPDIVKGWIEGQDERWFRERCSELDASVAQALATARHEEE